MSENTSSSDISSIPGGLSGIVGDTVGDSDETSSPDPEEPDTEGPTGGQPSGAGGDTDGSEFSDISEEGRVDIKIRADDITKDVGSKKDARLIVEDKDGETIPMDIWKKHNITPDFEEGNWYDLKEARMKVWDDTSAWGNKKELSSTKDLKITEATPPTTTDDEKEESEDDSEGDTKKIPEKELLDELNRLRDNLGKPPSRKDIEDVGKYSVGAYANRFGSIKKALGRAGIETWREEYSDEDMLSELREVAEDIGRSPSAKDMRIHGKLSPQKYSHVFGSWDNALDEAGLPHWKDDFTEKDIIDEIVRVAEKKDRVPSKRNMKSESGLSNHCDQYFGSWTEALFAAGYRIEGTKREVISDKELLEGLAELPDIDEKPTEKDIKEKCRFHPQTYRNRFGSIEDAIGELRANRREILLGKAEEVAEDLGVVPTRFEMSRHGNVLPGEFRDVFGGWKDAQKVLIDRLSSDDRHDVDLDEISGKGILYAPVSVLIEDDTGTHTDSGSDRYEFEAKTQDEESLTLEVPKNHTLRGELNEGVWYEMKNAKVESYERDEGVKALSITERTEVISKEEAEEEASSELSGEDVLVKRLRDIVELEPTNFDELHTRWETESMREAKRYARSELSDYYEISSIGIVTTDEAERVIREKTQGTVGIEDPETESTESEVTEKESFGKDAQSDKTENTKGDDKTNFVKQGGSDPDKEELIDDLQRVHSEVGTLPLPADIDEKGNYSWWKYAYEFGSIEKAYEAAELDVQRELAEEIEKVSEELGKKPKKAEVTEHGRFSEARYEKNFRSWSEALDMADVDTTSTPEQPNDKESPGTRTEDSPQSDQDEDSEELGDGSVVDKLKSFFE